MKQVSNLFRLMRMAMILSRYRVDELFKGVVWLYPFRVMAWFNPWRYASARKLSRGKRLRYALEALGPIYVKFGQVLSTRQDLFPKDIADELAKLQDQVSPFSSKKAKAIIEKNLGKSILELFEDFEDTPLASASIAQVHAAKLLTGESVAIKVLRPNVKEQIYKDLQLLQTIAKLAEKVLPNGRRLKAKDIVEEFETTLKGELDLKREAANASTLRRNQKDSHHVYIPEVYWDYCASEVLVLERISGVSIDDVDALKHQGSNLEQLAENVIDMSFDQIFHYNFFHADLHPGNIFVNKNEKEQVILVDFGIVGTLTEFDRRYIAENLLAFFNRDYHRVAQLHIECGWVDSDVKVGEFESAIRSASEPFFDKPLKDISIAQVMLNLIRIARQFSINIQPQLILLQKTFLNLEGLTRMLCPDLDLWNTAKPYLERWLSEQVGVRSLFKKLKSNLPYWIEKMPEMPDLVYDALNQIKQDKIIIKERIVISRRSRFFSSMTGLGVGLLVASSLSFAYVHQLPGWITLGVGLGCVGLSFLNLVFSR
jgi:ubiquinone biosynthesis protein